MPRQPYCLYCTRMTVISMEEGTSLVWRKALYLGSLNSNDLPRHFISMQEIHISMREIEISMQEIRNPDKFDPL